MYIVPAQARPGEARPAQAARGAPAMWAHSAGPRVVWVVAQVAANTYVCALALAVAPAVAAMAPSASECTQRKEFVPHKCGLT